MPVHRSSVRTAPGRPAGKQDRDVRRLLLEASQQLFASHGYRGVSVKTIADKAGVNPAMVYYYFNNKDGLFVSVVEETLHPIIEKVYELTSIDDIETFIEQFLDIYMTTVSSNPWFPVLLNREVLLPEGRFQQQFIRQVVTPVSNRIKKLLERQKARGEIATEVDPTLATINLISLAVFPFLAMPVFRQALVPEMDDIFIASLSRHTTRIYLHGVENED